MHLQNHKHRYLAGLLTVITLLGTAGCMSVVNRLGQDLVSEAPKHQVQARPAGYDPAAPVPVYQGPHPSQLQFDVSQFDWPVELGATGPIDTSLGPLQYPFACETWDSGLGQPLIDNQDGVGVPVFGETPDGELTDEVVGYSQDCQVASRVDYYYKPRDASRLLEIPDDGALPDDVEMIHINGEEIPFVVALERGTINRFLYGIAMLAHPSEYGERAEGRYWNERLIYYFRGGVGIGKRQGRLRVGSMVNRRLDDLAQGYGVIFSTGTQTTNHYNVWLAGHTAAMVKAQFESLYGKPRYTVGIGESGGAIQQYLIAQNQPGILDALIPVYSYPDMITQTIWALDCELLEYYFDVTDADNPRWRRQENRTLVQGLSASSEIGNEFKRFDDLAQRMRRRGARLPEGSTECAAAWRGLTPVTNNPRYSHRAHYYAPEVAETERFSHWHDLKHFYGVNETGYANRTYDNTGVQYGLNALRNGDIDMVDFLHLNANIGSWKPPHEMEQERLWLLSGDDDLRRLSLWSDHNMQKTPDGPVRRRVFERNNVDAVRVAPRNQGHKGAIGAAYHSGHVFLGDIDLPIIDLRHYLDPILDMHHSFASLSARLRIEAARGNSDNMLIWVAEPDFDPTSLALTALDHWLETGHKPAHLGQDACWDEQGALIAAGDGVWDGDWNGADQTGACMQRFPVFQNSRNVAGMPRNSDIFQCARVPVDEAIERGFYGDLDVRPHQEMLERIFPDGVCDYEQGDQGRPAEYRSGAPAAQNEQ